MRKPKQPGSAPHTHGWALGVQGQLMLFLCGITVLTLGLVWGLITYGLQPMYNRNIQKRLERESSVIAGMIDSAGPDFQPGLWFPDAAERNVLVQPENRTGKRRDQCGQLLH